MESFKLQFDIEFERIKSEQKTLNIFQNFYCFEQTYVWMLQSMFETWLYTIKSQIGNPILDQNTECNISFKKLQ